MVAALVTPALAQEPVVEVNMNALYEAVGAEAMDALPERRPEAPVRPAAALSGEDNVVRTLQILYGRGDLVVSPSARETLETWVKTFVSPSDRIAILSYSGHRPESWSEPSLHPGQEIATYSLHESIRTCFKRALVVRDVLIAQGVAEDRIVLRALGPAKDGGPAERIDVSLISPTP
ncbi:MAG: hypothetical protein D6763_04505 [Alphaproteobacteria bacterium]|nr:MAG: hypothetical protein D6763_04505 [Alphaproteobacteria bacterium]